MTAPTPYTHHDELEYIFVRSGSGTLVVNDVAHPMQPGSTAQFRSVEFFRVLPNPDEPLVIDYFRSEASSYNVLFGCPSYQPPLLRAKYSFETRPFPPEEIPHIERLMDQMQQCFSGGERRSDSLAEYLYMEFIGYYMRLY